VFFEVAHAPVMCNILCPTRDAALAVPRGSIRLGFCRACGHVYNIAYDQSFMQYDGAYENSLQFSSRFRQYLEELTRGLVQRYDLYDKDIIEIGCGQGDFLSLLCRMGRNRGTGFDPSFDPAKADTEPGAGVEIVPEMYSGGHDGHPVNLLCCRHVLEHLPEPLEFLEQVRRMLASHKDVVLFFEVPNALFTLEDLAIWDIIYEHCSYFTPTSLRRLFERAGFDVLRLTETYEGQFLTIEARPSQFPSRRDGAAAPDAPPAPVLAESVHRFGEAYRSRMTFWRERLDRLENERAVVWGAGSKGVTFLNTLSVSHVLFPYVVDTNPRKHGHFVVGTGQEIVGASILREYRPRVVIVMNGIYAPEISKSLGEMDVDTELVTAA
jgi:SAM-dependent methyltransferase